MDNEISEEVEESHISVFRSSIFTKIYATNVILSQTDFDLRIELFNEKFQVEDGWAYHSDGLMILTPGAAKKLLIDLQKTISSFEKEKGEIKISDERMKLQYLI